MRDRATVRRDWATRGPLSPPSRLTIAVVRDRSCNPESTMAAPLLLRQALLLRACFHNSKRFTAGAFAARHRLWCSAATNPQSDEADNKVISGSNTLNLRSDKYTPPSYPRWKDDPDPDFRKWKDKEDEILRDIEPILLLTKDILHSQRWKVAF